MSGLARETAHRQAARHAATRAIDLLPYGRGARIGPKLAKRAAIVIGPTVVGLVLFVPLIAIGSGPPPTNTEAEGLNPIVAAAYRNATARAGQLVKGCQLRWEILAGIGKVESDNASGRDIDAAGNITPRIIGVPLNGRGGTAAIPDTDRGQWDGDATWDHAVGPLQILPSTWRTHARDGNDDGIEDPHNIDDAAMGAAGLLCSIGGGNLNDDGALKKALFAYNHSTMYVASVMNWIQYYDSGGASSSSEVLAGKYTLPVPKAIFDAHPEYLIRPHHDYPAIDIPLPVRTRVYAVTSGVVQSAGSLAGGCGLGFTFLGQDGWVYVYCHGSQLEVRAGDRVTVGDLAMLSGNSGNSTGPHLHFGLQSATGVRHCPQLLLVAWKSGHALERAPMSGPAVMRVLVGFCRSRPGRTRWG